jgi:hypothetical protein
MLGLTGAWLTYVANISAEKRSENEDLKGLLDRLGTELAEISPWASGDDASAGYLPADQNSLASMHPDWFNPSRQIYSLEYPTIRSFTANPLLSKIRPIEEPFLLLNHALTNLYELHREYRAFVLARPDLYSSTLRHITTAPKELSDAEAEYMSHVFSYNRQLHQDLIGSQKSDRLCLYQAYREAKAALDQFKEKLPLARTPRWYWIFHLLGAGLAMKALQLLGAWLGFWRS